MNIGLLLLVTSLLFSSYSIASDANGSLMVTKQKFSLDNFQTFGGKKIAQVNVGWEAYGTLNKDKSNVILITHFFSGNSHAAGKYNENDAIPGYWDSIIGPGKAIDTNKFYVISSDTLVNASPFDKNVITTGPATIDPKTGKPFGLSFPVITIRDFVNVQKALIDSLGIEKLHAVVGASMGSLQALEWSVAYPDMVKRMISVIGTSEMDAWLVASLESWAAPIKQDPNWNGGDYYQGEAPKRGLQLSLASITQDAMHPAIFNASNPNHQAINNKALNDINANFPVVDWLYAAAGAKVDIIDANHILYLVRANQLFIAGHNNDLTGSLKKITAKTLFLPATNDLVLNPSMAKKAHDLIGEQSQYEEIQGMWGHLDGIFSISSKAKTISAFLETE
jgi:homoserine O-acetyltransferase/O-succinyltransferase